MEYREKLQDLERRLREYGEVAVSFSGGVDSTFLLLFAKKVLGENVSAVTISAPNFAPDEIRYAQELCKRRGYATLSWSWERKFFPPFPITRRIAVIFVKKPFLGKW